MGLVALLIDNVTGKTKAAASAPLTQPVDEEFAVGAGGVTYVTTSTAFTDTTKLDVLLNGIRQKEGSSYSFTRDSANKKINFTFTVPQNAWILVRLWV